MPHRSCRPRRRLRRGLDRSPKDAPGAVRPTAARSPQSSCVATQRLPDFGQTPSPFLAAEFLDLSVRIRTGPNGADKACCAIDGKEMEKYSPITVSRMRFF